MGGTGGCGSGGGGILKLGGKGTREGIGSCGTGAELLIVGGAGGFLSCPLANCGDGRLDELSDVGYAKAVA